MNARWWAESVTFSIKPVPNTAFNLNFAGKNYMVIATIPTTVIEVATELGMIDSTSQWLFLVANRKDSKSNTSALMSYVKEGGNVAVATNNSITNGSCDQSNDCIYYELFRNFAWALSKIVREEEAMYGQISDEEWEAIRLTKRERRNSMLEYMKVRPILTFLDELKKFFVVCMFTSIQLRIFINFPLTII